MVTIKNKNNFQRTQAYLDKCLSVLNRDQLNKYGERGVALLSENTPVRTGKTAASWEYRIESNKDKARIVFINTNTNNGENIAILIQYGHGTSTGAYVQGRDYINPALISLIIEIENDLRKGLSK